MKDWLDSSGRFLFGKHQGKLAEYVAQTDYAYVRWVVDNIEDISEEDREILASLLSFRRK